jgi:hypothetical protein
MWKLGPSERVAQWRDFRKTLGMMPLEQALNDVSKFWNSAPFTPYYLDNNEPEKWPDPWSLIYDNYYCDVAKCLGIIYTISLTEHGKSLDTELRIYRDPSNGHEYNLAWFDQGKYVLNMLDGEIVNKTQIENLEFLRSYTAEDLHLKNYNN